MSPTQTIACAAIMGGMAVILGAFGAHGLEDRIIEWYGDAARLETWKTAAQYQMFHALALLAIGTLALIRPARMLATVAILFLCGVIVFSGSLYLLVLTGIGWLGAITPIGGLLQIAGWILLSVAALRIRKDDRSASHLASHLTIDERTGE